jgi:N-acetylglutamate synthase-like GNAT family acetyltransferase
MGEALPQGSGQVSGPVRPLRGYSHTALLWLQRGLTCALFFLGALLGLLLASPRLNPLFIGGVLAISLSGVVLVMLIGRELRQRYRFVIPVLKSPLPGCLIRPATAADYDSCEAIYRLNEPAHFPDGHFDRFSTWLSEGKRLVLVIEAERQVRAFGGVARVEGTDQALFAYGMVHPSFHNKLFGTTLLLARLAALPAPADRWVICMSTVGGSHTFFQRFGFEKLGSFPHETGRIFDWYCSYLYRRDWQDCRSELEKASVEFDMTGAVVPEIPIAGVHGA